MSALRQRFGVVENIGLSLFMLFAGMIFVSLSGCTSVKYIPCPTLTTYSKADQQALAAELKAHPGPETIRFIGDAIGLRDQVRACQK